MAKIDFPDGASPFFNPATYGPVPSETKKAKGKERSSGSKPMAFKTFLREASVEEVSAAGLDPLPELPVSEETVQVLLDDVHSAGEELKNHPFPEEIKKYKTAVRNFLHYIVENGYTVEEQSSGANILKRKKFTLVQVVDRKLEQLAAGILAGQRSQLDILTKLDEIAGLLVNLLQ